MINIIRMRSVAVAYDETKIRKIMEKENVIRNNFNKTIEKSCWHSLSISHFLLSLHDNFQSYHKNSTY